jgi:hypothetical protein
MDFTIENFKKIYWEIANKQKNNILTGDDFNRDRGDFCGTWHFKRHMKLTYNEAKKKIGAVIATSGHTKGGYTNQAGSKKIECYRGFKHIIYAKNCIPFCNEVCWTCPNKQMNNIQASKDILSPSQEEFMRYEGISFGNSGILAADEGAYSK